MNFIRSTIIPLLAVAVIWGQTACTSSVTPLSDDILAAKIDAPDARWIDVRSSDEYESGHLGDAINIPLKKIDKMIGAVVPDKDAPVCLYCRSGRQSKRAQKKLHKAGYTDVTNAGGYHHLVNR